MNYRIIIGGIGIAPDWRHVHVPDLSLVGSCLIWLIFWHNLKQKRFSQKRDR
jgi:hypothetical protein